MDYQNLPITDLHTHIVPNVDDGSLSMDMSLSMLEIEYREGVRNVFCTSHNGYSKNYALKYQSQFQTLKMIAQAKHPDMKLYSGCELLCSDSYIDDILFGLENRFFIPLGNSKAVLTELYPDVLPQEAKTVTTELISAGYTPILAHAERYPYLNDGTIQELIDRGCFVQVNAYSLELETDYETKELARNLLKNRQIHFIGSDAHRINFRTPKLREGIQYIFDNTDADYGYDICCGNGDILGILK